MKKYRIVSEELADFAGIIYSKGDSLKKGLSEYALDKKSKVHPPKQNRIDNIERVMIKYNLDISK